MKHLKFIFGISMTITFSKSHALITESYFSFFGMQGPTLGPHITSFQRSETGVVSFYLTKGVHYVPVALK